MHQQIEIIKSGNCGSLAFSAGDFHQNGFEEVLLHFQRLNCSRKSWLTGGVWIHNEEDSWLWDQWKPLKLQILPSFVDPETPGVLKLIEVGNEHLRVSTNGHLLWDIVDQRKAFQCLSFLWNSIPNHWKLKTGDWKILEPEKTKLSETSFLFCRTISVFSLFSNNFPLSQWFDQIAFRMVITNKHLTKLITFCCGWWGDRKI